MCYGNSANLFPKINLTFSQTVRGDFARTKAFGLNNCQDKGQARDFKKGIEEYCCANLQAC